MRLSALCLLTVGACTDTGIHTNVSYDERFGDATTMDIHVPATGANRPAVMMIHGGAWRYGDKEAYTEASERFAAAGYVAATINYRLYPSATYPASVQDCVCALSFLRANAELYGIDPDRIAVTGYSAGGHLSALVAVATEAHQPECKWGPTAPPAAAIPGDGVYDITGEDPGTWITDWMGVAQAEAPEQYAAASPALNVTSAAPPFLVIHGHDDVVPIDNATGLVAALRTAGVSARLLDLGGAGHVTSSNTATDGLGLQAATDTPEAWAVTFDFLDRTLGAP